MTSCNVKGLKYQPITLFYQCYGTIQCSASQNNGPLVGSRGITGGRSMGYKYFLYCIFIQTYFFVLEKELSLMQLFFPLVGTKSNS